MADNMTYTDENILYPPFTFERCVEFADSAAQRGRRVLQYGENRYAIAPNEIMGEKEVDGEIIPYPILNPDYEQEQEAKEQARIQSLYMTRSDFFDGTIKAFGADSDDLLTAIQAVLAPMQISDIEKKVAINNYRNALNFYRKHPLFTLLADVPIPVAENVMITITSEQWDKFFDATDKKDPDAYKYLLPPQEEQTEE